MNQTVIEFVSGESEEWADIFIGEDGWLRCIDRSGTTQAYYPPHVVSGVLVAHD